MQYGFIHSVPPTRDIQTILRLYPQMFFACHRRHAPNRNARRRVNANQARILDHLDAATPTDLHTLARHMGVTASTMSLNIDRLESAGYVRRRRDRRDARRIELRLSAAGRRIQEQQRQVLDAGRVAAVIGRLKASERRKALEGLRLLAAAAREIGSESPDDRNWKGNK
jgi:DNA-binding MarR family transcriptional regulator